MEASPNSRMSLDFSIPLDIKILIMKALDNLDHLDALSYSCRSFYSIRSSELWDKIQLFVIRKNTTPSMNAFLRIRRFKKGKNDSQLVDITPSRRHEEDEEPGVYLANRLSIRKTIRWFSKKIFKYYRKDAQDESSERYPIQPSSNEIRRLEDALLEFWFHLETLYEPSFSVAYDYGEPGLAYRLKRWALGADKDVCFVQPDVPVQMAIHESIQALLRPFVWRYRGESYECIRPSQSQMEIMCPSEYHKFGMPNNLMIMLGLSGVQEFLESAWRVQISIMNRSHDHAEDYCTGHGIGSDGAGLEHFTKLFDELQRKYKADLSSRPLWNGNSQTDKSYVYKLDLAPWNQGDDFEYRMAFWDDQRLKNWGYQLPESIDTTKRKRDDNPSLREKVKHGVCTDCLPAWGCLYSEEAIARRKARFGDDFFD
ncbi:hypothetical protein TWF694_005492 [Orbilia ellipsospora]|uniref:F-box domain-containing protein n=1 Tax=Orbilia ellipsospora TaxID=2528407 RepID=A0AAV9WZB4_9PEZI